MSAGGAGSLNLAGSQKIQLLFDRWIDFFSQNWRHVKSTQFPADELTSEELQFQQSRK